MLGYAMNRNKLLLHIITIWSLIKCVRNWWKPIFWELKLLRTYGKIYFRDGDILNVSVGDWKCVPSIARLKRRFDVDVKEDGEDVELTFTNGVTFLLKRKSIFWQLGVINEVWDWDDYKVINRDLTGKTVIDIGGYIGDSALLFASLGATVHVFEPFLESLKMMEDNIKRSGIIGNRITVHPVGLGIDDKEHEVHYDSLQGSFSSTSENTGTDIEKIHMVNALDYLQKKEISSADILKIDCEGCEYELIESELLQYLNPDEIMLEYHKGADDLVKFLSAIGYKICKEGDGSIGMLYGVKL